MKSSPESPQMVVLGDKKGASPGAIMRSGNKDYIVKLGIPRVDGKYQLNDYKDIDLLTAEMSRRSCDEKIFFNIAQAVGDNKYLLPDTGIVFMRPIDYSESIRSVGRSLSGKLKPSINMEIPPEGDSCKEVIDQIITATENMKNHILDELVIVTVIDPIIANIKVIKDHISNKSVIEDVFDKILTDIEGIKGRILDELVIKEVIDPIIANIEAIKGDIPEKTVVAEVVNYINSTEIAHFRSEIITSYQDIGKFYKYNDDKAFGGDMRIDSYKAVIPPEPKGMGAFFALNNFVGNYDCIGASGENVGFDRDSNKLIIVDGGEARGSHKVSKTMMTSLNGKTWLDYNELSVEGRKEANETFARIANLGDLEIRALVTNNEQFMDAGVFTEEEIEKKMGEFRQQQLNIVEVYYDSMVQEGIHITPKIAALKEEVDIHLAEEQRKFIIESERREIALEEQRREIAASLEEKKNLLGKRAEDDSANRSNSSVKRVKLRIDPDSELTIFNAGKALQKSGISTPTNIVSPSDKENTPERILNQNRGGGRSSNR